MPATDLAVVELCRYALRPGRRDDLISMFDAHFIESQEACGMVPVGHFRDLEDPDIFVWFRGFTDMTTRRAALECFYTSPAWLERQDAANATMLDSDNVLLLRAARAGSGFDLAGLARPTATGSRPASWVGLAVLMLDGPADESFVRAFDAEVLPALGSRSSRIAHLVTNESTNDYPALPVRSAEFAFVAAGACPTEGALDGWVAAFDPEALPAAIESRSGAASCIDSGPRRGRSSASFFLKPRSHTYGMPGAVTATQIPT